MAPLSTQTLATQLADLIESSILDGTFKVGEKLKETELETRYGTSRTPLREALRILDTRGLIEVIPRKGCFVKAINIQDISDVCEITVALEALAVSLVHKRITPDGVKQLEKILGNMEKALSQKDSGEFVRNHEEYHAKLVSLTGNSWLQRELGSLRKIMQWQKFYFQFHEQNFKYSLMSHQQQLSMLKDPTSDTELLMKIDSETTRHGCNLLIEHIKKNTQEKQIPAP